MNPAWLMLVPGGTGTNGRWSMVDGRRHGVLIRHSAGTIPRIVLLAATSLALLWLAMPLAALAESPPPVRRLALVVGANDGGFGRVALAYAHSDARSVHRVLRQLGGIDVTDAILLLGPRKSSLAAALEKEADLLHSTHKPGVRLEFLFYYSGHSDEQGLLLSGERFPYSELKKALTDLPADVRVAILDSCASGALTRAKGGKFHAPFQVDESTKVSGHAFLTSTSADEARAYNSASSTSRQKTTAAQSASSTSRATACLPRRSS